MNDSWVDARYASFGYASDDAGIVDDPIAGMASFPPYDTHFEADPGNFGVLGRGKTTWQQSARSGEDIRRQNLRADRVSLKRSLMLSHKFKPSEYHGAVSA